MRPSVPEKVGTDQTESTSGKVTGELNLEMGLGDSQPKKKGSRRSGSEK